MKAKKIPEILMCISLPHINLDSLGLDEGHRKMSEVIKYSRFIAEKMIFVFVFSSQPNYDYSIHSFLSLFLFSSQQIKIYILLITHRLELQFGCNFTLSYIFSNTRYNVFVVTCNAKLLLIEIETAAFLAGNVVGEMIPIADSLIYLRDFLVLLL